MGKRIVVRKGTNFRSSFADGNPLWKVTRKVGTEAWEAVCCDQDFEGTVKLFSTHEIKSSIDHENWWKQGTIDSEAFYNKMKVGETYHYDNGFRQYVECVVVKKKDDEGNESNVLKMVAIKGEWAKYDLPRRLPDGSVYMPYYSKCVSKGETFNPHLSTIVESPKYSRRKDVDLDPKAVAKLPRIYLSVDGASEKQVETGKTMKSLDCLHNCIESARDRIMQNEDVDLEVVRRAVLLVLKNETRILVELGNGLKEQSGEENRRKK